MLNGSKNRIQGKRSWIFNKCHGLARGYLRDMVLGDIDKDGDVDWIIGTQGEGVKVYKNDGHGFFQLWQSIVGLQFDVRSTTLGDVNGDGYPDLLHGSVGNRIYFNDGKGSFFDSGQDLKDQYLTQAARFADVNGDGFPDLLQGNRIFGSYDSADRIYFNNGKGVFTDSGQRLGECSTFDIDLGDVDGDGDLDLVTVCPLNGINRLYLNDGKGFFTDSGQSLNPDSKTNETKCVALGDVTRDSAPDLLTGDWNIGLTGFLNDGYGNFTKAGSSSGEGMTGDVILVDIDNDGDLDIIEAKKGGACNKIYLNNLAKTPQISLTYNIRIGTYLGGNDIVTGVSPSGIGQINTLFYSINGLKEGNYYWSVQTVDAGFKKSAWSQENQFTITPAP